jgi:hypothetical protein
MSAGTKQGAFGGGLAAQQQLTEIIQPPVVCGHLALGLVKRPAATHAQDESETAHGQNHQRRPPDGRSQQRQQPGHLQDKGGKIHQVIIGLLEPPAFRVGGYPLDQIPGIGLFEQGVGQAGALRGQRGAVAGAQRQRQAQVGQVVQRRTQPAEGGETRQQRQVAINILYRGAVAHRAHNGVNQAGGDQRGDRGQRGPGQIEEGVKEGGDGRAAESDGDAVAYSVAPQG